MISGGETSQPSVKQHAKPGQLRELETISLVIATEFFLERVSKNKRVRRSNRRQIIFANPPSAKSLTHDASLDSIKRDPSGSGMPTLIFFSVMI